jgi:hypothetical protein
MITLQVQQNKNATQFCVDHYLDERLWLDENGPRFLPYHLRKHNCYSLSGVARGLLYCQDLFTYNDAWGQDDLYVCFQKYNVPYGRDFCDEKFPVDKYLLMQCYAQKLVPRGEEFCEANFDPKTETAAYLECYELIPLFTENYCRVKHRLQDDRVKCYRNKAKLTLDKAFCDNKHPIDDPLNGVEIFNKRAACYREI